MDEEAMEEEKAAAPWLELLEEVTEKILERLPLPDYVRFAAVCTRWLLVQRAHRLRHFPSPPPMRALPWYVTFDPGEDNSASAVCVSPWEAGSHRRRLIGLPGSARGKIFMNSSPHGWLVMIDLDPSSSSHFSLLNPVSRAHVPLPPVELPSFTLPPVVSPPPRLAVFVVASDRSLFVHHNSSWTQLQLPTSASSAVAVNSRLYCVSPSLDLFAVDPSPPVVHVLDMDRSQLDGSSGRNAILVESGRELLLVLRVAGGFRVFRADLGRRIWDEVASLGERVLLIEGGCAASLLADGVGEGVRGNCIYFFQQSARGGLSQWKVFDLGKGAVTDVANPTEFTHRMFVPSLC